MKDKRTIVKENVKQRNIVYSTCSADSVLLCNVDSFNNVMNSFFIYSPSSGELSAVRVLDWKNPILVFRAKVSAESEEIIENIAGGMYGSFAIRADDADNGLLFAYLLFQDNSLDYLVSSSSAKGLAGCKGEKVIEDRRRGQILIDYLAEFEKKGSIVISADKFESSLQALCSCPDIRSIAVVPSDTGIDSSIPVLDIREAEGQVLQHDNDFFGKMFLDCLERHNLKVDKRVYVYLLNNIDQTDKLETVRNIAERIRNLKAADDEYGTSILYNAIRLSSDNHCGVIASGGGAHADVQDDSIAIIRYLVSRGLSYKAEYPYDDIEGMASEMYDSFNLGIMFRTLIEAGYHVADETIYEFLDNFISFAQSNGCLTPIDDSHGSSYWQRLDRIRCEQFDTISPYIPDEVFSMRDSEGSSLLISAAQHLGNLPKLFKKILSRTKDVDALDEDGCSALHYIGDLERWDALVAAGADTDIKDREGKIPKLNFDMAELTKLLSKTEYSESDRDYAERMLFYVIDDSYSSEATYQHKDIILSLLDVVRPEARTWKGGTFLMEMIVQEGYFPEIYDKMLAIGVDINAVDNSGNNTLRIAVLSPECTLAKIRYLIGHGVDETPDMYKGTVATIAAGLFHIKSPEWNALWELSDKSIFTYHNEEVMSPIMVALHYMNMDAIRFLFSHDAVPSDEIVKIEEKVGKIKSKTTKIEVLKNFIEYKTRNHQ